MTIGRNGDSLHLPLLVESDEDGVFIISCPTFRACHSYGSTIEEAIENIKEVIALCLEEEKPNGFNQFIGFREIEIKL
jgi:predicted RNase H-like HicB family nuclease